MKLNSIQVIKKMCAILFFSMFFWGSGAIAQHCTTDHDCHAPDTCVAAMCCSPANNCAGMSCCPADKQCINPASGTCCGHSQTCGTNCCAVGQTCDHMTNTCH